MRRKTLINISYVLFTALAVALFPTAVAQGAANDKPKVIVLGFDGADARLTQQFIDEGKLPNMKRLAESGTFTPLGTTNPAQSPVSWASMETATNPAKHNIVDFVRRDNSSPANQPMPKPAGVHAEVVPADEVANYVPLTMFEQAMFRMAGSGSTLFLAIGGLAAFVVFFLISRVVLRFRTPISAVVGLVFGVALGVAGHRMTKELPSKFRVPVGEMEGVRFWDALDENGVRFVGLQVPAAFPCTTQYENSRLLAGLFTPDAAGGPGAWFVYTNDEWSQNGLGTETGGTINKLYPDPDDVIRTTITGPANFVRQFEIEDAIASLKEKMSASGLSESEMVDLKDELNRAQSEQQTFNSYDKKCRVDFHVKPDFKGKKVTITMDGGEPQTLAHGEWSKHFRVTFRMTKLLKVKAICRVFVEECFIDEDENPRLRLFVPPLALSPEEPPPVLPISSPRSYASDIAADIGLYDTYGWACYTNAVKDQELPEQAFLDGLDYVLDWRTKQLTRELDRDDWDVLFHVESTTDRAGHILYRFFDPQHPLYDSKDKDGSFLRDKMVSAYGRTFPLSDGISETYKEMDAIIGDVMTRINKGDYGDNCTLMVIADHGFQPFRYGVNLNVWLNKMGYLRHNGQASKEGGVADFVDLKSGDMLSYVDWKNTKAYAMGLGKIYLNVKGREQQGIVEPEDVAGVVADIIRDLEAFKDPIRGTNVVKKAYSGVEIYEGPYVDEMGDVIVGFNEGYRVSWQTSLGGYESKTVETNGVLDNDLPWSGDHCGVDPSLVSGIFFSNRKLPAGTEPHIYNIAPTILDQYKIDLPKDWDGTPLTFAGK